MGTRSRHEARWTDARSTASGRLPRNQWWVLPLLLAGIALVMFVAWRVYNGVDTVTYEVRRCQEVLTEDASWSEVQAAACDPVDAVALPSVVLMRGEEPVEPDRSEGAVLAWDGWAVNSPEHSVQVRLEDPAESIVVAEPTNERVRTELTPDAADIRWGGFIGGRGPTEYWVLITPDTP
ncbi:hypothetical protein AVL62_10780 [Serinicoccus chungangensis]|uniref:DUF2771 domain-containing protein n=1 Tax=Serinicoccus chungangensis TaxID=767452 RepID=A0A0W8IET5_9MICO|nr:hypothetical protein [Serinicoccus chungangensis]KUG58390.1 hypothetical protein AVL62_10780 [Serinicoccus chungangensis]